MTLLIARIIAQILSFWLCQGRLLWQAMIFLILETTKVISKKTESFWVTGYKGVNNVMIKRLMTMRILEYQQLGIERLLQLLQTQNPRLANYWRCQQKWLYWKMDKMWVWVSYGFKTLVNKKQIATRARNLVILWNLKKGQKKKSEDDLPTYSNWPTTINPKQLTGQQQQTHNDLPTTIEPQQLTHSNQVIAIDP